jgi:hypothetical protein
MTAPSMLATAQVSHPSDYSSGTRDPGSCAGQARISHRIKAAVAVAVTI